MNNQEEIISAALDGEQVNVQELARALQTAEGRETLAAFTMLRAMTAADNDTPAVATWSPVTMAVRLQKQSQAGWLRSARWLPLAGYRVPAALAATIAVAAVALSFWLGTEWPGGRQSTGTATARSGSVRPAPGSTDSQRKVSAAAPEQGSTAGTPRPCTPSPDALTVTQPRLAPTAAAVIPKPTRFLKFVTGVDWETTNGDMQ